MTVAERRLEEAIARHLGNKNVVPFPKVKRVNKPSPSVVVSGDGNIVGNGNTVIVRPVRKRVVANVQPGSVHISDAQAARLQQLVGDIAASGLATHQKVWAALARRYTIPQYRLLPAASFDDAERYLVRWIARAAPAATDEGAARTKHIAYIKTNQRKLGVAQSDLTLYLASRFQKASLRDCTIEELVDVRTNLVSQWKK